MASVQRKGDGWYCQFCYRGKRHTFAIGKFGEAEADARSAQVEYLLLRLGQRLIDWPPGVDIVEFVQFDGRPPARKAAALVLARLTLAAFRERYLETHRGSLEANTLDTAELHFKHLTRILGAGFHIRDLKLADLQGYADRRSRESSCGPPGLATERPDRRTSARRRVSPAVTRSAARAEAGAPPAGSAGVPRG